MKKNTLKRAFVVLLTATMLFTTACGNKNTTPVSGQTVESEAQSTAVESTVEVAESTAAESQTVATVESTVEEVTVEPVVKEPLVIADNAVQFAKNMKLGWNLGNTLDATGSRGMSSETSWGQPKATKELINYVSEVGFTTIRIPVSWHNHISDGVIDEEWMNRVQEVVDWAIDANLYVILNVHHDNSNYYPSDAHIEQSKEYIGSVWTQIATRFKDYDERLIFEGMNEPRLEGTDKEWWFAEDDADGLACIKNIMILNQLFVDTVRSCGGYNETRFLMVPSAIASPDNALNSAFSMPTDTVENHLIVSVHAYSPYDFTMNESGYSNWNGEKRSDLNFIGKLKSRFIDNGYGVVIGEFGATNKDNTTARKNWASDYCSRAAILGVSCVVWDNGGTKVGNENFGLINRKELSLYYPEIVEAMVKEFNR